MKKSLSLLTTIIVCLFLLACSNENKIKPESKQIAGKKEQPKKIKNELCYDISGPGKEYLISKTEYDMDGKKTKLIGYFEDGKESETINYIYDNGILTKAIIKWLNFDDGISEYTVTYKYDDRGRLINEKYEGDYATDVSPDFFEYLYDETSGDKPTEKLHYITFIPDRPMGVEYRETFKYDEKGNKIEDLLKGTNFEYQDKTTYEYDDDNQMVKSYQDDGFGKISKYRYAYEYY